MTEDARTPASAPAIDPRALGAELRALVPDGATIAVGGNGLTRKPMALLRALVTAGARELTVVSYLGAVDVELLLSAGAVAELHTAGVSLEGQGLAPRYRAAREAGTPRIVLWSEGSLHAALEAGARGLPSLACTTSPASGVVAHNPHLRVVADAFTGTDVVHAQALPVDVALVHVSAVDEHGNLHVDGDLGVDDLLVRAARTVVASSPALGVPLSGSRADVSRLWVDRVVEAGHGAWPTACAPAEAADTDTIAAWASSKGREPDLLVPVSETV